MNKTQTLRWIEQFSLAIAAGCCGVFLYLALYPSFYYLSGIGFTLMLWVVVPTVGLIAHLAQLAYGRSRSADATEASAPAANGRFIAAMLVVVTVAVAFKAPLYASFLVARPGLEEALAEHRDDLAQVGRVHHDYGLYQISRAHRGCHVEDRIYFEFRDDAEAAIIYSESGIEDLCYNSGNKGHLLGNWYWMKED